GMLFGKPIDGEISQVFNRAMIGTPPRPTEADRFNQPISARTGQHPVVDEALLQKSQSEPVSETSPETESQSKKPQEQKHEAAEAERKGLFDPTVGAEISMVFNKSQLGNILQDDRFDKPISQRATPQEEPEAPATPAPAPAANDRNDLSRFDRPI